VEDVSNQGTDAEKEMGCPKLKNNSCAVDDEAPDALEKKKSVKVMQSKREQQCIP
jgi:hypothetical protein